MDEGLQQVIEEIAEKTNSNGKATTAKEVAKQLQESKESLTTEIINEIGKVTESLHAKQRALNHFSIAFMGIFVMLLPMTAFKKQSFNF